MKRLKALISLGMFEDGAGGGNRTRVSMTLLEKPNFLRNNDIRDILDTGDVTP